MPERWADSSADVAEERGIELVYSHEEDGSVEERGR